jgi:hypothetical protein
MFFAYHLWVKSVFMKQAYSIIRLLYGILCLLVAIASLSAQETPPALIQYVEDIEEPVIMLADSMAIGAHNPGYTLILPDGPPEGLIIGFHPGRDTTHAGFEMRLYTEAVKRKVAMLFVTTGNPVEFLFDTARIEQLDRYIGEAITTHGVPQDRILCVGMSLAGTRALRYTQWCYAGHSAYGILPRAVAVCDAPLDMIRFWRSGERSRRLGNSPISANEAKWVNAQLERHLGGPPDEQPGAYRNYSPYYYDLEPAPQLELLRKVAVRAYTEPDIDWWMANRGKSYYGINAPDAAGLINDLQLLGNTEAELITTSGQGYHPDGRRHPHSWKIVDNAELVEWLLGLEPLGNE